MEFLEILIYWNFLPLEIYVKSILAYRDQFHVKYLKEEEKFLVLHIVQDRLEILSRGRERLKITPFSAS